MPYGPIKYDKVHEAVHPSITYLLPFDWSVLSKGKQHKDVADRTVCDASLCTTYNVTSIHRHVAQHVLCTFDVQS